MNEDAMSGFIPMTRKELLELTREVKESLAYTTAPFEKTPKIFTASQLWYRLISIRTASKRILN